MAEQTNNWPTRKTIAGTVAATLGAPVSLLCVYLINGLAFGCWADPTASAVACKLQLPESIEGAITAIVTGAVTLAAGYFTPPGTGDHIQ